jgi:serine/threonine-protein kinase HipA
VTISEAWLNAPIHQLDVWTGHLAAPVCVGRLNYEVATGTAFFEWGEEARKLQWNLSPLMAPLSAGIWSSRSQRNLPLEYQGLPGVLNDALPDGWGLYLMDSALARMGIKPELITPATRLAYLGDRAWGSLSFRPVIEDGTDSIITVAKLAKEVDASIEGHLDAVSNEVLRAGSSPQGARPKVMVDCDEDFKNARVTSGTPAPGYRSWLIKFAARDEPVDAPVLEQVYMDCARMAGLSVMESRLLVINGKPAFAADRFDRSPAGRIFCHSLGGLIHFSHRSPGLDYVNVAQVMERLRVPETAYRQAFTRAVFNAAMSVRDDHSKNFAFVMGAENRWDIAPAYDLTYMAGPGGYHSMSFAGGQGVDPAHQDLLNLAPSYHLDPAEAGAILEEVLEVARQVGSMARGLGASPSTLAPIERKLDKIALSMQSPMAPTRDRARKR